MSEIREACERVVDETLRALKENPGWERQYAGYASRILINLHFIREACSVVKRHLRKPFTLHLSTTNAMDSAYKVKFDGCYWGQKIMSLTCDGDKFKVTTKEHDKANEEWFGCVTKLADCEWDSQEAKKFREHFESGKADTMPRSVELLMQGQIITEMAKAQSADKHQALIGMQPVMLSGARFMMRTAISASDPTNVKFGEGGEKGIGGHIDLLMRAGLGAGNKLCVVEFKRKYGEVKKALQQGTAYAVFLRELLRSKEAGHYWWDIFGYTRDIPEPGKLNLLVTIAMPRGSRKADDTFGGETLKIGKDKITLHYIYFDFNEIECKVKDIASSLA